MGKIYLVSCVRSKLADSALAKDLYDSRWFKSARRYAEKKGCPWYVLSAKHGIVHPDCWIAPYDQTLNKMSAANRRQWADRVLAQLEPHLEEVDSVVFLAGKRYREFLDVPLQSRGLATCGPMEGLRIGEQLRWLKEKTHG